ncbi:MAG: DUF1592 domain-containing protein [Verrucomicrobiales bacterium]|nr:DUF1592 domain-containing protein [Verrucomicrobiales bacterium]
MARFFCSIFLGIWLSAPVCGDELVTFFSEHCTKCHGSEKQEGDLRLDRIGLPQRGDEEAIEQWLTILDSVESGDMPPRKEPRPDGARVEKFISRVDDHLASIAKPIPALRRMTRFECEKTLHDLLKIDVPLAEYLPEDSSVQGFDNVATGLGISSILMERYLEAANAAFDATIRRIKPLPPELRRSVPVEEKNNRSAIKKKSGGVREVAGAYVDPSPHWPAPRFDEAHPIEDGIYQCRVSVWPNDPGGRTLTAGIFVGPMFSTGNRRFIGIYDVTGSAESPRVIEFTTFLQKGETIHILPWIYPVHVSWRDKHEKMPGVAVSLVETYGPLDQDFPSKAQQNLFGNPESIEMKEGPRIYDRHRKNLHTWYVDSNRPEADAERIIREFVSKAFRRPVDDALVDQFVELTLTRLENGSSFEQAVRTGITAVLCSPHFLLVQSEPEIDDYALASRLSYFLCSSLPDDELLSLASAGKLKDRKVRYDQVERMLKDSRSERFIENFTNQWLDLRDIEFTTPDGKLYPEYDDLLLQSMLLETRGFFRHLLENDLSVNQFIDSDFVVINERLAAHYGIPGVQGHEKFRIVPLPEGHIRGGILTQASILKVTANGTNTSPIIRGNWVLENLLGEPAPPPPPGIPAVEPDIRGATTIREQMAKHSENETCARCHARIDPPGFALEEFDAIGLKRSNYRTIGGDGEKGPNRAAYRIGHIVETGGVMADGREFADFVEFQKILLSGENESVARAIAEKLLIYGTGRPVTRAEGESVDFILETSRKTDFGLRSMIHAVVESKLFHQP